MNFQSTRFSRISLMITTASIGLSAGMVSAQESQSSGKYSLEEIVVTAQKREATLLETPVAVSALSGATMEIAQIRDVVNLQSLVPSMAITQRASASNTSFSIRSIGSSTFNFGLEPAVGVFVDGVYRSRNGASVNDFLGVERVEVLRGPQSTLFGKNTTAGVINFITKAPEFDTYVEGEATYGNYDAVIVKGAVNVPVVSDKLAMRIDGNINSRDGVIDNADGRKLNERDRYGLRGQLLYTPSETVRLRVIADYTKLDEECCAAPFYLLTPVTSQILTFLGSEVPADADPSNGKTYIDGAVQGNLENWGVSAQLDVNFDGFDLTSITAYRKYDEVQNIDADFSDLVLNKYRRLDQSYDTFTQEIRITSTGDGPVEWMGGAYYFNQDLSANNATVQGAALRPFADLLTYSDANLALDPYSGGSAISLLEDAIGLPRGTFLADGSGQMKSLFNQDNESYGLFGQVDWHVTDQLTLTAGLRYTHEKKSMVSDIVINDPFATLNFIDIFVGQVVAGAVADAQAAGYPAEVIQNVVIPQATAGATAVAGDPNINPLLGLTALQFFPPADNVAGDFSDGAWTGNFIANYHVSDQLNVYASYSRGYKAGGFALDSAAARLGSFDFDNETAIAYEIGAKIRGLDNRLHLDLALFDQTIKDFQENVFIGTSFAPDNAGKIKVRGLEVDSKFQVTPNFQVTGGFAWYFDAKYAEFENGPCPAIPTENCYYVSVPGAPARAVQDLSGFRLSESPKFTGYATATYSNQINDSLEYFLRGELYYKGSQNLSSSADARQVQDAYALVGASVGIGDVDGAWQLQLWARNLFDQHYVLDTFESTIPGGSLNAYVGDPRTYGLTLRFKY